MSPWLEPFRRSYQSIREKLLGNVKQLKDDEGLPLITDTSEGNIITLLISLFSSIAEVIHVYIDNVYRESFLDTATHLESVTNHVNLIDYKAHMATPSVADVFFTRSAEDETLNTSFTRDPETLTITDSKGNLWVLDEKLVIPAYVTQARARFVQHYSTSLPSTVLTKDERNRMIAFMPKIGDLLIEDGSIQSVFVGGDEYLVQKTMAYSKPTDKHCVIVSVNSSAIYVRFGDGLFGSKPSDSLIGSEVTFSGCRITAGSIGNIPANSLTSLNEDFGNFSINNLRPSSGGTDYEDLSSIQYRAPLSVKTLGVAVTKNDILNIVRLNPQVARAELEYVCGQYIRIYVSGLGNTAENEGLCSMVKEELLTHLPMNTQVEVVPIQERTLRLNCKVTGRPSYDKETIRTQIINALYLAYNISSVSTADATLKGIRISDMYALIDNLSSVDYLTIREMYLTPWLEPLNSSDLVYIDDYTQAKAKGRRTYVLAFTDQNNFIIYPYNTSAAVDLSGNLTRKQFTGKVGTKCKVDDGDFEFEFTIKQPTSAGNNYKFEIIEGNQDIEVQGYFNVVINTNQLTLDIEETV